MGIIALTMSSAALNAQVTIGEEKLPEQFSSLELISNQTRGMRLPQLKTVQRDALTTDEFKANSLAEGLTIFNTDTQCVEVWNGKVWISLCALTQLDPASAVIDCPVLAPYTISLAPATGSLGIVAYKWQQSSDNVVWTNAAGVNNRADYTILPNAVTGDTYYRRMAMDAANGNAVIISASALISAPVIRMDIPDEIPATGLVWATRNVDAPGAFTFHAASYGMLYQWSRNTGWSSSDPIVNSSGGTIWDSSLPSATSWNTGPCPDGWRLPTSTEYQNLINSGYVFVTNTEASALNLGCNSGIIYNTGSATKADVLANYKPDTYLFFHATTNRNSAGALGSPNGGYYWSSTQNGNLFYLYFNNSGATSVNSGAYSTLATNGYSVRCVKN